MQPIRSIDLQPFGIPRGFFDEHEHCRHEYTSFRSLLWQDSQDLVFTFSTNPQCSDSTGPVDASLRLLRFDTSTALKSILDLPFEAGDGDAIQLGNSIDLCPDEKLVVHTVGDESVLTVLSPELKVLRVVHLPFGTLFHGTTVEHGWIIVSTRDNEHRDHYNYYSPLDFQTAGSFLVASDEMLGNIGEYEILVNDTNRIYVRSGEKIVWSSIYSKGEFFEFGSWLPNQAVLLQSLSVKAKGGQWAIFSRDGTRENLPVLPPSQPKGYLFGFSRDAQRFAIGGYSESYSCESAKEFVPWFPCRTVKGERLFVLDRQRGEAIFERVLPGRGRAALAPDGKHLAILESGRINIYELP